MILQKVVITQPTRGGQPQNVRDWSTGICGCFEDMRSCVFAWFCPPCFMYYLARSIGEFVCGPCFFGDLFVIAMRTKLRIMYGIKGSILKDCCWVTFCTFCAVTQMYRELVNQGADKNQAPNLD